MNAQLGTNPIPEPAVLGGSKEGPELGTHDGGSVRTRRPWWDYLFYCLKEPGISQAGKHQGLVAEDK